MQSTPTLKDTDPHDVFAIESLLAAHAEKAPPLAHDPATPSVAPQIHVAAKPQVDVAPPISVSAPIPQVEPTFRAPDVRDIPVENVRPSEIKVDGLKPPAERPMSKWVKRVVMTLLGLCGAMAAAAWQHYGDQAKAMAAEWLRPLCWLRCLRQPGVPSRSSRAPRPPKPPRQSRPLRNRQQRLRTGSARTRRHCRGRSSYRGIVPVAIDGAGSRRDGPAGRGVENHHRAAQGEPGPNGA